MLLYYPESAEDIDQNISQMLSLDTERTPPANEVVYMQVGTGSQILMGFGYPPMRLLSAPFKFSGIRFRARSGGICWLSRAKAR